MAQEQRVTEDSQIRVTEDGQVRVTEASAAEGGGSPVANAPRVAGSRGGPVIG